MKAAVPDHPSADGLANARAAIAFAARRQGRQALPASEWAHLFSLELRWLSPAEAGAFVEGARLAGLFVDDDGLLAAGFEIENVEVPRRFRLRPDDIPAVPAGSPTTNPPRPDAPDDDRGDPFQQLVGRIATAMQLDAGSVLDRVAQRQEDMGGLIEAEAAALLLAAEGGIDVRDDARIAWRRFTTG